MLKKVRGFTLIELMVVVVVLSVMTVMAVSFFGRYQTKARRGEAIELMNDVRIKQESFFAHYSRYVSSTTDETVFSGPKGSGDAGKMYEWSVDCADANNAAKNAWCLLGFRPKGHNVEDKNFLYFQMQTIGWSPSQKAPTFVKNSKAYWLTVQARGLKDGDLCTLLRLTNQVKDALIYAEHKDCP